MSAAQRVMLSDEVRNSFIKDVVPAEKLNEVYAVLEAAYEFYRQTGRTMTLADYEARGRTQEAAGG